VKLALLLSNLRRWTARPERPMTPREVQEAVSVGAVVKVYFDRHVETILVISLDPDGILGRPISAATGETAAEFWLAYNQISRIEKV
jgi:hypothetical protein